VTAATWGILHFVVEDSGRFYGPVSGWVGDLALISIPVTMWRHKICHTPWCCRIGRHPDGLFMRCARHHDQIPT
jgi:hypothetical protein